MTSALISCVLTVLPQSPSVLEILDEWEFIIAPLIFTAFAVFTRLWKIGLSPIVTWDVSNTHGTLPLEHVKAKHLLTNCYRKPSISPSDPSLLQNYD